MNNSSKNLGITRERAIPLIFFVDCEKKLPPIDYTRRKKKIGLAAPRSRVSQNSRKFHLPVTRARVKTLKNEHELCSTAEGKILPAVCA